jgi:NDP-sugar pyrophosphorylase family protein
MSLAVAILAGGLATRLGSISRATPKILLDVGGKPFAVRQIELLQKHGLKRIVLCLGHLGAMVQESLGDGRELDVKIDYIFDGPQALGTGGALRKALPLLGDAFLVLYGDSYLNCDYQAVIRGFRLSGKQGLMTVFRNEGQWDRSNVIFRDGKILAYDKKQSLPEMQHIDYGLGVLQSKVVSEYPSGHPFDLAAVYQDLLKKNQLAGFEVKERFYEIGSPSGLEEMREYFSRGKLG